MNLWRQADDLLYKMVSGADSIFRFLPVHGTTMILPGGLPIHWPQLQWDDQWQSFKFLEKQKRWKRIWGGFLVQNVISALASVLVRGCMLRLLAQGFRIILQEHDAIGVLIVDDANKNDTLELIRQEMCRVPDWAPGLPLDAEAKLAETWQ